MRTPNRRLLVLFALLIPAVRLPAAEPPICGSLDTVDGVRVLRVWGTPFDRGFAHGRLLAADIVAMVGETLLNPAVFPEIDAYESAVRERLLRTMKLPRARHLEIEGMFAGIRGALGEDKLMLPRVNRALLVDDLVAINTFADWAGSACSSFSAWGDRSADGHMITARNLDYTPMPAMQDRQLLIAHLAAPPDRRGWVTVAWPGIVGAYTAMNDAGVTVAMHDTPAAAPTDSGPFTPRSVVLAEILERSDELGAMTVAQELMTVHRVRCGNNVLVSTPFHGQDVPAAVFEYDADRERQRGVTRRTADQDTPGLIVCTNHYRTRAEPRACDRYAALAEALAAAAAKKRPLDAAQARQTVTLAARDNTLHTVVFQPNAGLLDLSFTTGGATPKPGRVATFKVADLLKQP